MLNKDYTARLLNLENVIITNVENHVRLSGNIVIVVAYSDFASFTINSIPLLKVPFLPFPVE